MAQNVDIGMKCIKYMLFVSNFMFVMVGVLLISFGSTIKSIYYDFELFMEDHYFSPAKLTIAVGIIILLISAFGCAAAIKESTCMVNVYALLLTLVLILELSTSIAAYTMRANIEVYMEDRIHTAMNDYYKNNETRKAVDDLQFRLSCCGVHSANNWLEDGNATIPQSCCVTLVVNGDCKYAANGCLETLSYLIRESTIMLGTGALCITIVQVLGIAFAIMLAKSIRRIKTERAAQRWQTRQELYLQLARGNGNDNKTPPSPVPVTYTPEKNVSSA